MMLSRQELNMMPEIHAAIHRGQFHDLRLLVSAGENVNKRDKEKRTPLIVCTLIEKEEWAVGIARMLLEQGAMIGYKDKLDRNALIHACLRGRSQLASVFLRAVDYDLNHKDRHGNTALFYAASSGHEGLVRELVKTLKRYNFETDLPNKWGMTPLLEACRLGHKSCADVLIDEGSASKDHRDDIRKWNAKEWSDEYDKNNVQTGVIRCRTYDKPWLQTAEINQSKMLADNPSDGKREVIRPKMSANNSSDGKRAVSASSTAATAESKTIKLTRSASDPLNQNLTHAQAYKTKMNLVNRSWTDPKSNPIKVNFYPSPAPFSLGYHLDESRPNTSQPWRFTSKSRRLSSLGENEDQWSEEFRQLYKRFEIEVTRSYRQKAKTPVQPVSDEQDNQEIAQPNIHRNKTDKTNHHHPGHQSHHHPTGHHQAGHHHGHHPNGNHQTGNHHHGHGGHHHPAHHGHPHSGGHHHSAHHQGGHHSGGHHPAHHDNHNQGHSDIHNQVHHSTDSEGRNSSRLLRRPSDHGKRFPVGAQSSDSSSDRGTSAIRRQNSEALHEVAQTLPGTSKVVGKSDDKSSTSSGDSVGRMVMKAFRRRRSSQALNVPDSVKQLARMDANGTM